MSAWPQQNIVMTLIFLLLLFNSRFQKEILHCCFFSRKVKLPTFIIYWNIYKYIKNIDDSQLVQLPSCSGSSIGHLTYLLIQLHFWEVDIWLMWSLSIWSSQLTFLPQILALKQHTVLLFANYCFTKWTDNLLLINAR